MPDLTYLHEEKRRLEEEIAECAQDILDAWSRQAEAEDELESVENEINELEGRES